MRTTIMENEQAGILVVNAAIALFAGVLGSLITLLVTSQLQVTVLDEARTQASSVQTPTNPERVFVSGDDDSAAPILSAQAQDAQAALQEALDKASAERAQLAAVLARLTRQIEVLESDVINQQSRQILEADDAVQTTFDDNVFDGTPNPQDRFNDLVAAGIDASLAELLQSRQNQYQLARLDLFDQAQREGWIDSEQFSERLSALDDTRPDLRDELGDDAYDRYLFEAGRNNRVSVASVIPGSAAEIAGIQAGDLFISYASQRVFNTRELQQATRAGQRGEPVSVSVERQGQTLFYDIPRGPLGVSLNPEVRNPS